MFLGERRHAENRNGSKKMPSAAVHNMRRQNKSHRSPRPKPMLQLSNGRHILTFILLVAYANGLSTPRSIHAPILGRPLQIFTTIRRSHQSNRYNRLYQKLSNSDSTSLDDSVSAGAPNANVNITERIESEIQQKQEAISQQIEQEKEEFQVAVNEVKEAVVDVKESAKNLGGAMITKGPGIAATFFKLWLSEPFR
jgi:hypothetical protein